MVRRHRRRLLRRLFAFGFLSLTLLTFAFVVFLAKGQHLLQERLDLLTSRLRERYEMTLNLNGFRPSLTSARVDRLELRSRGILTAEDISVHLGLNPLGGNFFRLGTITLRRAEWTFPGTLPARETDAVRELASWLSRWAESHEGTSSTRGGESLMERLRLGYRFHLNIGEFILRDRFSRPVIIRDLALTLHRAERQIDFNMGQTRVWSIEEPSLRGSLALPGSADEPATLNIARALPQKTTPGFWNLQVSGKTLPGGGVLSIKGRGLPRTLLKHVRSWVPDSPRASYDITLGLARASVNDYALEVEGHFNDVVLKNPLLASNDIGPFPLRFSLSGAWLPYAKAFLLDKAEAGIPMALNRATDEPMPLSLKISGRTLPLRGSSGIIPLPAPGDVWEFSARLPETSCQAILEAAPIGLLNSLEDFRLEGTAGFGVSAKVPMGNLENFSLDLTDARYQCRVREAPRRFLRSRLDANFTLERPANDGTSTRIEVSRASERFTSLDQIASAATGAFISAEDAGFWQHEGIDLQGVLSSLRRNLAEARVVAGGSTITQQTVKNLFLGSERTVSRKLQEMFLASHLERTLPKRRILEIYMNIAELGPNIFGIGDAARLYFGKPASQITPLEGAFLATLLPSPVVRYTQQFCRGEITPNYRLYVDDILRRMRQFQYISQADFDAAMRTQPAFNFTAIKGDPECRDRLARYRARKEFSH